MILDIDHIGFVSDDFENDINLLQSFGFKVRFLYKGVENLKIKKDFLKKFVLKHNLALCDRTSDISIEIINYPNESSSSFMQSIFFPLINKIEVQSLKNFQKSAEFREILIKISDVEASLKFWKNFGFKECKKEDNFIILKFRSILKNCDYFIRLVNVENSKKDFFLDNIGFNSLALISTSAQREGSFLERLGFKTSKVEELILGDKKLSIVFVKGPDGELVEIISLNA